jgi:hypothetical protein
MTKIKKIGIITFHRTINYGGVLQAYALKKTIEQLGAESNIIDYKNLHIDRINKVKFINFNGIKGFINGLLTYKSKRKKFQKFVQFRNKYIQPVKWENEYTDEKYDSIIVGSDQVWNYLLSDFDKTYFLDFVNDSMKKNAYSASFGISNVPAIYREEYAKLLSSFNKISVREDIGVQIIKDLINIEVPVVLDPIFLIQKTEWMKLFQISKKLEDKYILLYLMIPEPDVLRFSEELSKQTGYEIIYITNKVKRTIKAKYVREISPIQWVDLFLNATYIVTNSFHGVAFSINFNKEFFMGLLPKSSKVNSRLENILKLFNLEERRINRDSKPSDFNYIKYEPVNEILKKERDKSIGFLKSIIEEKYE